MSKTQKLIFIGAIVFGGLIGGVASQAMADWSLRDLGIKKIFGWGKVNVSIIDGVKCIQVKAGTLAEYTMAISCDWTNK